MQLKMTALEREVMDLILDGPDGFLNTLREQINFADIANREYSGCGFFTLFSVPPQLPRIPIKTRFTIGDVAADIAGLKNGAGFVLFIENGALDMLEGFTYDEAWPVVVEEFSLRYTEQRDQHLDEIRKRLEN
jgi:hypothetical protein